MYTNTFSFSAMMHQTLWRRPRRWKKQNACLGLYTRSGISARWRSSWPTFKWRSLVFVHNCALFALEKSRSTYMKPISKWVTFEIVSERVDIRRLCSGLTNQGESGGLMVRDDFLSYSHWLTICRCSFRQSSGRRSSCGKVGLDFVS